MAVDTRLKRQSATCLLAPYVLSPAPPDTSGVVQAEWQAMAWVYSGITAGALVDLGKSFLQRIKPIFMIIAKEQKCL